MFHVMHKENEIIMCQDDEVNENKKKGFQLYSGSTSEKNALEMARRLEEQMSKEK
ncbi:hypothetical protein [Aneurinibacillus tyrosinisolvens]|uniref:hypothetical protein n=1 Tax=Aneurinibacillus tyrosinisolvens TaxID=1443435 RepID=UPI000A5ECA3D|nr:hypothetical protein [Aneurinibacillus tyrosinisolvens]